LVKGPMLMLTALVLAVGGCGEGDVASDAVVSVYAAGPLCREAQGALATARGRADGLDVRVICLPRVEVEGAADLATAGADARHATEDSTSVAYLEAPGAGARFSQSIVESADIAWVKTDSGAVAMSRVLEALEERGSSSPRAAVLDQAG
jgi:hypothetical protein